MASTIEVPKTSEGANTVTQEVGRQEGTTQFVDNTLGVVSAPESHTNFTSEIVSLYHQPGSDDIVKFLERPMILASGAFSTVDSGILYSADPFVEIMQATIRKNKLNGVFMVRADVVLTLQVNAVRFQTGRYILGHIPSGGGTAVTSRGYLDKFRMHTADLCTISQTPHVEVDLGTMTHCTLEIPYMNIYPYVMNFGSLSPPYAIGKAFIIPYVPLSAASGDTTASYTLWAAFKNVSLSGAVAQSSYSDGEQKKAGVGPITRALGAVSTAASILGVIPVISGPAMTVAWIADKASKIAHIFGWSKPVMLSAPVYVVPRIAPYTSTSDQISTATMLSTVATNKLVAAPGNGHSKYDELSIDFIKQVYGLLQKFTWTSSDVAGTSLTSITIYPSYSNTWGKGVTVAPVAFLTTVFRKWRGSMVYRFKLVKNEFYSGRLLVSFNPSLSGSTPGSMALTDMNYRVVFDIRTASEFEICVPFISPRMYHRSNDPIGDLTVWVLDPLVAPSTVPSTISVIVEYKGGPDFEVADPNSDAAGFMEPYVPAVAQSSYEDFGCHSLGTEPPLNKLVSPAAVAIGEQIESLRQIVKMPFFRGSFLEGGLLNSSGNIYYPYVHNTVGQITSNSSALLRSANVYCDYIDLISQMYTMTTGSLRLLVAPASEVNIMLDIRAASADSPPVQEVNYVSFPTISGVTSLRAIKYANKELIVDTILPPYQSTIGRSVCGQMVGQPSNVYSTQAYDPVTRYLRVTRADLTGNISVYYMRQAADDWNAMGFISTVPMVARTQT